MTNLILRPLDYGDWANRPGITPAARNRIRDVARYGPVLFAKAPDGLEMAILSAPEQKAPFIRAGIPFSHLFTLREILELLEITQSNPADAEAITTLMRESEALSYFVTE